MNSHLKRVLILLLIFTFVFQMAGVTSLSHVQAYADTETEEALVVSDADEAEDVTTEEIDTESPGEIETDGENPPDAAEEPADPEAVPEETAGVPEETPVEEETVTVEEPAEEPVEEEAEAEAPMLKAATKAEKTGTVLAFTSDTHNKSGNAAANRLGTWIEKVKGIHGDIDVMAFGGDMAGAGASGYWDLTQADINMLAEKDVPGVYTTGNHEISMGGDFSYNSYLNGSYSSTETKGQFEIDKEVASGDDYRIYCLGSRGSSESNPGYSTDQISDLDEYLMDAGNDKVIFIITHFPLHYFSNGMARTTTGAAGIIDTLNNAVTNNGQTIVFLWGHNHTLSDTYYDQIYGPGGVDSIQYGSSSSNKKTIKFYYGAAGCMSDNENGTGSKFVQGKGLAVTITPNRGSSTMEFHYYNADGKDVTESNSIKSVNVEVTDPIPATGVTINEATGDDGQPTVTGTTVAAGKTLQLHLTLEPAGASSSGITWSSSDESVATVSDKGLVTAKKEGKTTITAAIPSNAKAATESSIEITVTAAPKEVSIAPTSSNSPEENATIDVGETLTINVTNGSSSNYNYTASLSNSGIAQIEGSATVSIAGNGTGQFTVTGLTSGTVDITIQNNGSYSTRKGTIHLTVGDGGGDDPTPTGETVDITPDASNIPEKTVQIDVDETFTIKVTNSSTRSAYDFTATFSKSGVAEIQGSSTVNIATGGTGQFTVKGIADGTVDITISNNNSNSERKGIIHLTVGEGGGDDPIVPDPGNGDKYYEVSSFSAEKEYVIGTLNGDNSIYAIKNGGGSNVASEAISVTAASGTEAAYVSINDSTLSWTRNNDNTLNIGNTYIYPGSDGNVRAYSGSGRAVMFTSDGKLTFTSSSRTYYITWNGTSFGTSNDETNAATFRLFEKSETPAEQVDVTGISLNKSSLELALEGTETLTATVEPANATNRNVNWSSSDTSVATVDSTGKVTGVAVGEATITATSDADSSISATCTVTVSPVSVNSVSITPSPATVSVNGSVQLTANIIPENASNKNVTWASGDTSIATIDNTGKVIGVAEGETTITVTTEDGNKTATCNVTVAERQAYVIVIGDFALSTDHTNDQLVNSGSGTQQFIYHGLAGVEYTSGSPASNDIRWYITEATGGYYIQSSDGRYLNATYETNETGGSTGVLKLDETPDVWVLDGTFEQWEVNGSKLKSTNANKSLTHEETSGNNTINLFTVRSTGETTSLEEAADPIAVTGVTLDKNTAEVQATKTLRLTATVFPENATDKTVTWTSSDPTVATVDETGKVTGVKTGSTATITATAGGKSASCEVTVTEYVAPTGYVIMVDGYALSHESADPDYFQYTGTSNNYFGLKAVEYDSENDPDEDILWIITLTEDETGYYITDQQGNYLNATYSKDSSSNTIAHLLLNDTPDKWSLDNGINLENWIINVSKLSSANATEQGGKGYYLARETGRNGTNLISIRSESSADDTSLIDPAHPVETFYVLSNTLTAGEKYLIVNTNEVGSGFALGHSGSTVVTDGVTINTGKTETDSKVYIDGEDVDGTSVWTAASGIKLKNGTYYLRHGSGGFSSGTTDSNNSWTWDGTNNRLSIKYNNNTYYLRYSNNTFSDSTSTNSVYLYKEIKIIRDISTHEHTYGTPTYAWAADNTTCTATAVCSGCEEGTEGHTVTETVNATSEITTPATCEGAGVKTFTATFTNTLFSAQTKTEDIAATGHAYGTPKYVWASDNSSVTATRVCANDASHVETETVAATSEVTTEATCTEAGVRTWTSAAFSNTAFAVQTTTENIPAINHDWAVPTYEWADDHTSVTATRICNNNASHVETETVAATSEVTTGATCTEAGVRTWTSAAFENEAFAVQTATETIPKLDHDWEFVNFTWTGNDTNGYTAAVANYKCKRNESHTETVDATVTPVTTVATCEDAGQTVYTAEVAAADSLDGAAQSDSKTVAIEALGHKWSTTPTWTWTGNDTDGYTAAKATFICENDATHKVEEEDTEIDVVTVDPTPTTAGSITYTASVTGPDNQTYTDRKVKTLTPTGYTFKEPVYTWTEATGGGYSCTALKECNEDQTQNITETVTAVPEVTTPATCETAGVRTYTATFAKTDFEAQTKTEVIPPLSHDWSEPAYTWAADHTSVTATRTCKNDASHVETETAAATGEITTAATCTTNGVKTWTSAAFENEAFTVQTTTETIPAINHDWNEPTYEWAADHTSVTATRTCKNNVSHTETETVAATGVITTPATCTGTGVKTWTSAAFENAAFTVQTTTETIPAINHDWNAPIYVWATDNSSVTATRTCKNDSNHVESETAVATGQVTTPATCTQDGVKLWTSAAFSNTAFEVQRKTETLPATNHNWSEPTYVWADDYSKVTATRTCQNDPAHVETDTATATGEVTKAATCTEPGVKTWTSAAFSNTAFTAQTTTEAIPATDHVWIEPAEWTWIGDEENGYTKVEGTFTCQNDSTHTQTVESTNITVRTVDPTPTQSGKTTYTAKVTGPDNVVYSIQKEIVIPPAGYTYKDPVYTWNATADGYSVTALKECNEDPNQNITETVNASYAVTTPATCVATGVGTYTAAFTNSAFTTQTQTETIAATGHNWKQPTGVWNADHTSVVVTFVCNTDVSHTETVTASGSAISSEITTQPTATTPGVRTYKATVTLDGETYTVTDTEAIPATGSTVSGNITSYKGNTEEGQVTIQLFAGDSTEAAYTATVTGNTYTIEGVAAGTYTMKVSKKDHVTRSYEITTDGTALTQDVKIHLLGDVTGDGKVTTGDVARINSHVKGVDPITDEYLIEVGDVISGGGLTTGDVARVNSHAKGVQLLW